MTDTLTKAHRSWVMSRIRSQDTKPELIVRSLLHRLGYRFSLRRKDLPGRPDIVLPKHRSVIFVHGCFWHRHAGCPIATTPGTRRAFWLKKFAANVERDERNQSTLRQAGWKVGVLWECEIQRDPVAATLEVLGGLGLRVGRTSRYALPSRREILKAAEARSAYTLDH